MKIILLAFCFVCTFASCKKEVLASTERLNETVDSTTSVIKYSGVFTSGPYGTVSGRAEIVKQGSVLKLQLKNFDASNGPALHMYLSKQAMPIDFIDLGSLKSTSGNQVYDISGMPDFAAYKYVSVHCVDYNHLFGYAPLN
ncbi:DM13 domain-containing protein [Ferruginibacter sp. HRS2-29]|uniref:DM13 domain-containing protein n=1 Tax=Ferruginibacter sp. HRS2-29 TaxID=2487334 RepID=UPI0020CD8D33|nr:DM13 domain-containing protein [Ferruginibacter sp. HRS2-29]MCP9753530.1 hypothetical protein [Ferruginibacter sp. HRS2-29]